MTGSKGSNREQRKLIQFFVSAEHEVFMSICLKDLRNSLVAKAMIVSLIGFILGACAHHSSWDYKVHKVRRGETLAHLGKVYRVPWQQIASLNGVGNPIYLRAGQHLRIPPASVVKSRNPVRKSKRQRGLLFDRRGLLWPSKGPISSYYGPRNGRMHQGIDIRSPRGSAVKSTLNGKVSFSGWMRGYGRTVIVKHNNGLESLYAHLSKSLVRKGQRVYRGQQVGKVGRTGKASGYHLHFEVRKKSKAINPIVFFPTKPRFKRYSFNN